MSGALGSPIVYLYILSLADNGSIGGFNQSKIHSRVEGISGIWEGNSNARLFANCRLKLIIC